MQSRATGIADHILPLGDLLFEYGDTCAKHKVLFIVGPFCVFLLGPLASVTMDVFPLANFPFITANFVSSIHVILSLASFRFLLSPKLSRRRIGATFFFLRQYFDELDGKVAYFWMDRHMHTPG